MEKEKIYLSLFFLFLSGAIYFLFLSPLKNSLDVLKIKLLNRERELKSLDAYFQNLSETLEKIKQYETTLSKIDFALPKNPLLPEFFNFIQMSAANTGILFKSISSIAQRSITIDEERQIREWTIGINLLGSYFSLKNFLSLLERSARLIEIKKISFGSPKEKLISSLPNVTSSQLTSEIIEFSVDLKIKSF